MADIDPPSELFQISAPTPNIHQVTTYGVKGDTTIGMSNVLTSEFADDSPSTTCLEIHCTICYNTRVIPFRVSFQPGISLYEQVMYAAKKAIASEQLRAGDPFPSVRELSKALKINPNTAHKVVTRLVAEGILQVYPGIGTVVAKPQRPSAGSRSNLLDVELEQLVVEGKRLGLTLDDMISAVARHWKRLDGAAYERHPKSKRSLEAVSQERHS